MRYSPTPASANRAVGEGPVVEEEELDLLATAVEFVAGALGDRDARQRAADWALAAGRTASHAADASSAELRFARTAPRTAGRDVMVFMRVAEADAKRALAERDDALRIPSPPAAPRMPFRPGWRH